LQSSPVCSKFPANQKARPSKMRTERASLQNWIARQEASLYPLCSPTICDYV
jgi:hypothetical protein